REVGLRPRVASALLLLPVEVHHLLGLIAPVLLLRAGELDRLQPHAREAALWLLLLLADVLDAAGGGDAGALLGRHGLPHAHRAGVDGAARAGRPDGEEVRRRPAGADHKLPVRRDRRPLAERHAVRGAVAERHRRGGGGVVGEIHRVGDVVLVEGGRGPAVGQHHAGAEAVAAVRKRGHGSLTGVNTTVWGPALAA